MLNGRIKIVWMVIATVAGVAVWFHFGSRQTSRIRNVLLISLDTCRADHLSCYGHSRQTTPNIDAIADAGVLFTRGQSTNPITLPAHCSMLTGTNPTIHGVHANDHPDLDDSNVTLAEIMRDHGYQTAAVIGAFPLHSRFGLDQGFDHYDQQFGRTAQNLLFNERNAQKVSNAATKWLEQNHDKPFFLFVHYFDPHQLYTPPEPFASSFEDDPYAGEIAYTDFCIGQIIEKLKQLELFDSTLLIITSDHGESLKEHNEETHAFFIYQSTIRVPLIIKAPDCTAGHKINDAVSLIDIVPTVLGLLDLSVPPQVQGVDLSGYLYDQGKPAQGRFLYSESWYPASFGGSPLRGIVHDKWRYIWSVRSELYDLNRDSAENNNLFEEKPQIATMLQSRLQKMLTEDQTNTGDINSSGPDMEALQRLQSIGYVAGPTVIADLTINPSMEDPKDLIGDYEQYCLAQSLWDHNRLDEAKALCLNILAHRPDLKPVISLLGAIAVGQGHMADAIHYYSQILTATTETKDSGIFTFQVYNTRGNAYQELGNHDLALADFNKAIELKPDYVAAYNNRGNLYTKMDSYDQALADYTRSIQLAPDYEDAYLNRGMAYGVVHRYEQALADFSRAIDLKPGFAAAYFNRGNAYRDLRQYDQAFADYTKAIELNPDDPATYNNRANLYTNLGRHDSALADYTRAIAVKPDFTDAYFNRGVVHLMLRQYDQAASDYTRVIELQPDYANAHTVRGNIYTELGRYDLALADFSKAIELNPQDAQAHLGRAGLLATCVNATYRDGKKALASATRAHELFGGDHFTVLETLAAAYAESSRFTEAVKWQTRALELAPPGAKSRFLSRLKLYQAKKPYRQESSSGIVRPSL